MFIKPINLGVSIARGLHLAAKLALPVFHGCTHLGEKMTRLGNTRRIERGYNPFTGFPTRRFHPKFFQAETNMYRNPFDIFRNIRNLPVVFRGGGFAGRAGCEDHRLRFSGSSN